MATALRPASAVAEPLWMLMVAPAILMSHFLACYLTAALSCGRWSAGAAIGGAHTAIALYTIGAVSGIGLCLAFGVQARRESATLSELDGDAPEHRQHVLAAATVLLALMSLAGAVFVAASAWMVPGCA